MVVTSLHAILRDKAGTAKPAKKGTRVMPADAGFERPVPSDADAAVSARMPIPVAAQLAIPVAAPRGARAGASRQRWLRWLAAFVTIVAAAAAILLVAAAAVMMGIS
jgi:hypothetical protein